MVRYAGPFLFLFSVPIFFYELGSIGPLATVLLLIVTLIGAEFFFPRGEVSKIATEPFGFRVLLYLYIVLQLGFTVWAADAATHASAMGVASLAVSVGVTTGVFGVLAAHEMVHSKSRRERLLGVAMLSGMSYRHFRIAHVYGHHRWAATTRDPATARLGEGFYAFLLRTIVGQFVEAFRFERKRCRVRRLAIFANGVVQDVVAMASIFTVIFLVWGAPAVIFFVAESAVAIVVLEMFNYIAHYGLERDRAPGGHWERMSDWHSWNSSNVGANLLIFNMGRHSFHHREPSMSFEGLQYLAGAPELPKGYAGSMLLALIPPLWRRVMNPRARRLSVAEHEAVHHLMRPQL